MDKRIASFNHNINDLPDEVLSLIISFLPIKEAVRTSILSRRWRYIFSLTPNLDLEINSIDGEEWKRFVNFVDRLLFYLDIPSIVRFRLICSGCIDPERIGAWICALVWHKVQELELWIDCDRCDGFQLPQNLFSCESLVVLKLNFHQQNYELKIPARVRFPHLKTLYLDGIGFPNNGSEERLFSSCIVLEELVLSRCWFNRGCVKFIVSNPTLKRLNMHFHSKAEGVIPILVDARNLLGISYNMSSKHFLKRINVKLLFKVMIGFQSDGVGSVPDVTSTLRQIQKVYILEICNYVLRELQSANMEIPLFHKMIRLSILLWEYDFDPVCLEDFLSRCTVLENLVFKTPLHYVGTVQALEDLPYPTNHYTLQKDRLAPLLLHLKTVEVHLYDAEHAGILMPVIEFFLENANGLNELKVVCEQANPDQRMELMTKLMSFPRASNNCQVLF